MFRIVIAALLSCLLASLPGPAMAQAGGSELVARLNGPCSAGDSQACATLAGAYMSGRGAPKNPVQGARLLDAGCRRGHEPSCEQLAQALYEGSALVRNPGAAVLYFEKSCNMGYSLSCSNAGNIHFSGEGVKRDQARGTALFELGCQKGDVGGCFNAGNSYAAGAGVPRNVDRAVDYYSKSCRAGFRQACTTLSAAGIPVAGDPAHPAAAVGGGAGTGADTGEAIDCNAIAFTRTTPVPSESFGKYAFCMKTVARLGNPYFKIIRFSKTDGQLMELAGLKGYRMFYSAEIMITRSSGSDDCREHSSRQFFSCMEDSVGKISRGASGGRVSAGSHSALTGEVAFDHYESGWKYNR